MDAGRQPCNTQGLETQNSTPEPHTTPKHHIHLPPTPPATDEPPIHASSVPFLDGVQTLEAARKASEQSTPWTQVQLDPTAYDLISRSLENGFRRHDFDRGAGVLSFRMPSPVHDFFSTFLADDIHDWLKRVAAEGGESGEFAAKIANGGSSRIFLREGDLGRPCEPVRRQPDAQFQHDHTAYPGVVVEISYSQDGKTLEKLAQDYILLSNGDINAVIGIDINYGGKVSTVSVWRPLYTREGHDEYLEAEQRVAYKVRL
ncbi:uncharacterized protein F5Z01DRAFT_629048 [Emericellopsis atlantica]|uniref:Uncharacterized protein n=1 Tax=Emericellopsis atlantica TaxID=2614577 RepID=A0A9P7ZEG6_9HYPO|nr:uncharacterized protein F5Z01DRAFT_629048 [Emericellopsis atlantica]KAG9250639.1 hypothetical protein F5Z01DRAFT_629048 [Emericellopsis atlantica]